MKTLPEGYRLLAERSGLDACWYVRRALVCEDEQRAWSYTLLAEDSAMLAMHWARLAMMAEGGM